MDFSARLTPVAPVQPETPLSGEVIPPYASYAEYKAALDGEVKKEIEGYVHIGYLLKIARDTNILFDSGYENLYDFAQAEYSIDKSRVSRYMAINDRFAKGGYSMELREEYKGYGVAKLSMMLTLPDEINEELSPSMSKSEIKDIRDEVTKEQQTTPIEHMLIGETEVTAQADTLLEKAILQLGESDPDMYEKALHWITLDCGAEKIVCLMAPAGEKVYSVRIRGIGRILMSIKDYEEIIALVNERTGEKETYSWEDLIKAWENCFDGTDGDAAERYMQKYGKTPTKTEEQPERMVAKVNAEPEEAENATSETDESDAAGDEAVAPDATEEVAPVQPETQKEEDLALTAENRQETDAIEPDMIATGGQQLPEREAEELQEQQLPGQINIADYPGIVPQCETITREEFDKSKEEYIKRFESYLTSAGIDVGDGDWSIARNNLQKAMECIDSLEELYEMEVVDEEK